MNRLFFLLLLVSVCQVAGAGGLAITGSSALVPLDSLEAAIFIRQDDDYLRALTVYDVLSSMKQDRRVTLEEYRDYLGGQTLNWSSRELRRLSKIARSVRQRFRGYAIPCPDTVFLIKTTGLEMDSSAYTRRNAIFVPQSWLKFGDQKIEAMLIHEIFHVISRHNPSLRESLYNIIGFHKCRPLAIPSEFKYTSITNPDYPVYDYYVNIQRYDTTLSVIPLTCAKHKYDPKQTHTKYRRTTYFLEVQATDTSTVPIRKDGKLCYLGFTDNPEDIWIYFENVRPNTGYYLSCPEEILAEDFRLMFLGSGKARNQWVIDSVRSHFKEKTPDR